MLAIRNLHIGWFVKSKALTFYIYNIIKYQPIFEENTNQINDKLKSTNC